MNVTLNREQLQSAVNVGAARHMAALRRGLEDRHGALAGGWSLHIEGACGEYAAAIALHLPWTPNINTFKGPAGDIGRGVEVRTRSRHDYDLIVRKDDFNRPFVLVTGIAPRFRVRGWIMGDDAKRPEWLREHGGREAAYFVPFGALRPLIELEEAQFALSRNHGGDDQ